jgi:hypothetical protein
MGQQRDAGTPASIFSPASTAKPLVSLCLIVRDEAELLPRFLQQVAGLWDELCVVDTGSQDGSQQLLRAAGATVLEQPWTGDFSEARNASLAMAHGTWIVVLDADEMVSPEFVAEVRALAQDADAGAATVRMVNTMAHGRTREAHLLRIFRNDRRIRFRHRVHEECESAVTAYLETHALVRRTLRGEVMHLGYERARAAARGKKTRDEELLRQALAEDPLDLYSWMKLLELARFWSDTALASEVAPACLSAIDAIGPEALRGAPWGGDLAALLATALHAEEPRRGRALLERLGVGLEPSAAYWLRLGQLQEQLGESEAAERSFRACLALATVTADRELGTVRPLMGLARLALARPQGLEDAWAFTEQALGHNPRDPEALVAATAICRIAGGAKLVNQFVTDYTAQFGETEELRAALAS